MSPASGLESLYQELILDHARRKVGFGLPTEGGTEGGTATSGDLAGSAVSHQRNPVCGDEVTLRADLSDDGGRLAGVAWEGLGCSISQASGSMLADLVGTGGLTLADLERLTAGFREAMRSKGAVALDEEVYGDAAALSGVSRYTARVRCAMLPWVALEDAVRRARCPGS